MGIEIFCGVLHGFQGCCIVVCVLCAFFHNCSFSKIKRKKIKDMFKYFVADATLFDLIFWLHTVHWCRYEYIGHSLFLLGVCVVDAP
jgi:hypothetical protein